MVRINAVETTEVGTETRALFARLAQKLGRTPNLVRTMAISPAVLDAYLTLGRNMSRSSLTRRLREQIGLAVSELNPCHDCIAAHNAFGRTAGFSDEEIVETVAAVALNIFTNYFSQVAGTERDFPDDHSLAIER